jgi:hypothetical protein
VWWALWGDFEGAVRFDEAVGHAARGECSSRAALTVEENQATRGVSAMREFADAGVRDSLGKRFGTALFSVGHKNALVMQKINRHLGHHDFHDTFAVACAGDASGFGISVAATTNKRGIAHAPREFAAGAAGGCSGDEISIPVERDGTDRAELVAEMIFGSVRVFEATMPGRALTVEDELVGRAERDAIFGGESFSASGDQHHVLAFFEDEPRETNRIAHAFDGSDRTGLESRAIHDDSVELDAAFEVQVRTDAGVERRIVFEDDDGRFHSFHRRAAARKNLPAGLERTAHARAAIFDRFFGNIPRAAVNDERGFQSARNAIINADTTSG